MDNGQQTVIMKRDLTASTVFSAMAVFGLLRTRFRMVLFAINLLVTGRVALDRIDDYLKNVSFLISSIMPLTYLVRPSSWINSRGLVKLTQSLYHLHSIET
jgi:hypothetical protein